jgi:hypothetical protein
MRKRQVIQRLVAALAATGLLISAGPAPSVGRDLSWDCATGQRILQIVPCSSRFSFAFF